MVEGQHQRNTIVRKQTLLCVSNTTHTPLPDVVTFTSKYPKTSSLYDGCGLNEEFTTHKSFVIQKVMTTVHMYTCTHVHMYACMHVHMYACMHVHMYACMHVHMYTMCTSHTYLYFQKPHKYTT